MIVLLGIGFLAGVITAVSPCVLPVLPIVLAGGATGSGPPPVRDHRRPRRELHAVHARGRRRSSRRSGCRRTSCATSRSRCCSCSRRRCSSRGSAYWLERPLAFMTRRRGGDLGGGFVLGVSLGLVFVPCAGPVLATITALSAQHKIGFDTVSAHARVRARRRRADAADRAGRPARRAAAARAEPRTSGARWACCSRAPPSRSSSTPPRACRPRSAATRPRSRSTSRTRRSPEAPRLAARRRQRVRGGRGEGIRRSAPARPRPGARLHRHLPLAEHARRPAALARLAARQGRARRLLDVLVHQLHPHAARTCAPGTPRTTRTASRSSACTRPSSRSSTCSATCVRRRTTCTSRWPVALDNGYGTWTAYSNQYWPAEYLIDKRRPRAPRRTSARATTAGPSRRSARSSPRPARGAGAHGERRRHDADGGHHARVVPRHGAARALRRHEVHPNVRGVHVRAPLAANDLSYAGNVEGRRASGSSRASTRGCGCTSTRASSTSCSAAAATVQALVDGKPGARCA